jgi:hypothetical protein
MFSLRDDRVRVPLLNALKFLQWECKNGERGRRAIVRRWATRREALGALLRCKNEWMSLDFQDGCLGCPYIEFEARTCTKKKVLSTEGS